MSGMKGDEFKSIRQKLGLSRREFGRALGFRGSSETAYRMIKRLEDGHDPINIDTAGMARALALPHSNTGEKS